MDPTKISFSKSRFCDICGLWTKYLKNHIDLSHSEVDHPLNDVESTQSDSFDFLEDPVLEDRMQRERDPDWIPNIEISDRVSETKAASTKNATRKKCIASIGNLMV